MSKLVCHVEKRKITQVCGLERHNERTNGHYGNAFIDTNRSCENIHLYEPTQSSYLETVKNRIATRHSPSNRSVRKDAVALVDFIISSDHAFFADLSREDTIRYFEICQNYLSSLFDKDSLVFSVIHMDETTPHLHLGFVPMTKDNRLAAKDIINRNALLMIQDILPRLLEKQGFSIVRGTLGSSATHQTDGQFKAHMETQAAVIATKIEEATTKLSSYEKIQDSLNSLAEIQPTTSLLGNKITLPKKDFEKLEHTAQKYILHISKEKELKKKISSLQKEITGEKKKVEKLTNQLTTKDSIIDQLKHTIGALKDTVKNLEKQLQSTPSVRQQLTLAKQEELIHQLSAKLQLAQSLLEKHGLSHIWQSHVSSKQRKEQAKDNTI